MMELFTDGGIALGAVVISATALVITVATSNTKRLERRIGTLEVQTKECHAERERLKTQLGDMHAERLMLLEQIFSLMRQVRPASGMAVGD